MHKITNFKTHIYTNFKKSTNTQNLTLQNPHSHTQNHTLQNLTYTHSKHTKPRHTHTHALKNPHITKASDTHTLQKPHIDTNITYPHIHTH